MAMEQYLASVDPVADPAAVAGRDLVRDIVQKVGRGAQGAGRGLALQRNSCILCIHHYRNLHPYAPVVNVCAFRNRPLPPCNASCF